MVATPINLKKEQEKEKKKRKKQKRKMEKLTGEVQLLMEYVFTEVSLASMIPTAPLFTIFILLISKY